MKKRRQTNPLKMSERAFQQQVIDCGHLFGWRVAHFRPARVIVRGKPTWRTAVQADGAGFPDLVMARDGIVIFAELKTDAGTMTVPQREWLHAIHNYDERSHYFMLWRPKDWDAVERTLRDGP
jgi:hypothetical protein